MSISNSEEGWFIQDRFIVNNYGFKTVRLKYIDFGDYKKARRKTANWEKGVVTKIICLHLIIHFNFGKKLSSKP